MDTATLINLIPMLIAAFMLLAAVLIVLVVGGVLLARQFIPALQTSVPASIGTQALELTKSVLLFGLNQGAARTETLDDDQLLINALRLIPGTEVTGSPDAGYTIVVPPKPGA